MYTLVLTAALVAGGGSQGWGSYGWNCGGAMVAPAGMAGEAARAPALQLRRAYGGYGGYARCAWLHRLQRLLWLWLQRLCYGGAYNGYGYGYGNGTTAIRAMVMRR